MNKNFVYALLGLAGLAVVFIVYLLSYKSTSYVAQDRAGDAVKESRYSLNELLESGSPIKCTYSGENGVYGALDNGFITIYAAGGKIRYDAQAGEVSGGASGSILLTHVVIENGIEYVWTEKSGAEKTGTIIDLVRLRNGELLPSPAPETMLDLEKKRNMVCVAWTADELVFNLSEDIKFLEYPLTPPADLVAPEDTKETPAPGL